MHLYNKFVSTQHTTSCMTYISMKQSIFLLHLFLKMLSEKFRIFQTGNIFVILYYINGAIEAQYVQGLIQVFAL